MIPFCVQRLIVGVGRPTISATCFDEMNFFIPHNRCQMGDVIVGSQILNSETERQVCR